MTRTRSYRFVQVDVFTERPLAGNSLAVVFEAADLSSVEMQAIAREMNLAETTFLLKPRRPECAARMRIFTPGREVPFAGHPTIGTSWVLATNGLLAAGTDRFLLEEEIGPVPVEFDGDPARPRFVWMRHRDATFGPEVTDRDGIAHALRLNANSLLPNAPIQSGSTGNSFLYVPLRDRETVDRAELDTRTLEQVVPGEASLGIFVFAPDRDPRARRVYSRMFAPHAGVPEDPATGSASGALGAYLVRLSLVEARGETRIMSEQGTKMGRQSFVHIALHAREGVATDIRVGGAVVPVIEGRLTLPAAGG